MRRLSIEQAANALRRLLLFVQREALMMP